MKFNYQEHANKPGIYKIINTHTSRIYIGQAARFKERWQGHHSSLRTGRSMNRFLLNDFNKCKNELGHDDFLEFHVIEVMEGSTKEERNKREKWWIEQVWDDQKFCYNFKREVDDKARSCWSSTPLQTGQKISIANKGRTAWNKGLKASDEHKLILSNAHKGRLCKPETKLKMSEALRGEKSYWFGKTLSEEHRRKLSESHKKQNNSNLKKEVFLIGPDGLEYRVVGITAFIKERGLSNRQFFMMLKGERAEYKGWRLLHVQRSC